MAEIVVNDFAELRAAITSGLYDKVILGADITYGSGGIQIPNNMTTLTIDGQDPISGLKHSITDRNNTVINDTIYVNAATNIARTITVQNIIANIRNFYGIINVYDSSNNQNVVVRYLNIEFYGVQAVFNRYGQTIIEDSDLILDRFGSVSAINEVSETRHLILAGKVNITSYSTANSTFWFAFANSTFTIKEGAIVNIIANSRELIYADSPITFTLEQNSTLIANCYWGMFYTTGNHQASLITIGNNAKFYFQQNASHGTVATVRCQNLVANPGSDTLIRVNYPSSANLIEMTTNGSNITINDPKRFALYNFGNVALKYNVGTGTLVANAQQINYWSAAADPTIAGGINDFPLRNWKKSDLSNVTASATVASSTTTIISSNILVPEDSSYPLDATNYPLHNARVLSYGRMNIDADPISDNSLEITGSSEPEAEIKITTENDIYLTLSGLDGDFRQPVPTRLAKESVVNFLSAKYFLYANLVVKVAGSLRFLIVPSTLQFRTSSTPTRKKYILRMIPDWAIEVKDTRDNGSDWTIFGQISEPLHTTTATLDDALIYLLNHITKTFQTTPIEIYRGVGNSEEEKITKISWDQLEGVLVETIPDYYYQAGLYQTEITWTLVPD